MQRRQKLLLSLRSFWEAQNVQAVDAAGVLQQRSGTASRKLLQLQRSRYQQVAAVAALQQAQAPQPEPGQAWRLWGASAAAAAAAAGAVGLLTSQAACDSAEEDPAAGLLDLTHKQVLEAWNEVDEDLYRLEAAKSVKVEARPQPPNVQLSNGVICVEVPIRQGVGIVQLAQELLRQLNRAASLYPSRYGRLLCKTEQKGRTLSLRCETHPQQAADAIAIQLSLSQHQPSSLVLQKCAPLSADDLAILRALMRSANTLSDVPQSFEEVARALATGVLGSGGFERLEELVGGGGLERRMAEMVRSMESVMGRMAIEAGSEFMDLLDELLPQDGGRGMHVPADDWEKQLSDELAARGWQADGDQDHPRDLPHPQGQLRRHGLPSATAAGEPGPDFGSPDANRAAEKLNSMGALVYPPGKKDEVDWESLAGYEEQKQQIEDTLLLALLHPEVYSDIAKGTRKQFASNRPRAVLFEGPPGCGKTTSARVIASQASVPLVYVPLEAVVSKWYGESERQLAELFKLCEKLPGCLIFLDEIDSLATSRNSEMHEATRRLLGVLLRQLDGFQGQARSVVIAATNRKQDLDPALLSRFDTSVEFGLPGEDCRSQILKQYAKHLSDEDLKTVAAVAAGMSGRDLRDVCEQAERRWASKIIRGQAEKGGLPPAAVYVECANQRAREKILGHGSRFGLAL